MAVETIKDKTRSTQLTIAEVRRETSAAIVFVSFGKDSLVLLDLLYPKFDRLVCVFMYFVRDLEHINRYLRYCRKRYPQAEWVQTPHWNLSHIRRAGMYCDIEPDTKRIKLADKIAEVRGITGLYWVFLGMKKADSLNRRLMLMQLEKRQIHFKRLCLSPCRMDEQGCSRIYESGQTAFSRHLLRE